MDTWRHAPAGRPEGRGYLGGGAQAVGGGAARDEAQDVVLEHQLLAAEAAQHAARLAGRRRAARVAPHVALGRHVALQRGRVRRCTGKNKLDREHSAF